MDKRLYEAPLVTNLGKCANCGTTRDNSKLAPLIDQDGKKIEGYSLLKLELAKKRFGKVTGVCFDTEWCEEQAARQLILSIHSKAAREMDDVLQALEDERKAVPSEQEAQVGERNPEEIDYVG